MPDLNYRTPEVRAEMARIARLWLDRGADGFRLDAARHIVEDGAGDLQVDTPETHAFWKEFAASVRIAKPQATLVGEAWTETSRIAPYYGSTAEVAGGDELPMTFDFPLAEAILAGISTGDATGIAVKLAEVKAAYPPGTTDAPFLTNHDQVRIATRVGNDAGRLASAAAILLTLPGSPFLYYGEEVGLQNGTTGNDEAKRTPMPWDDSAAGGFTTGTPWFPFAPGRDTANVARQTGDTRSLLSRYRTLIRLRKSSEPLRRGDITVLGASASPAAVLAYLRKSGAEQVLVAHNLSAAFANGGSYAIDAASAEPLFADTGAQASGGPGNWRVMLPPYGSGLWRLR
jgi:glycosidase